MEQAVEVEIVTETISARYGTLTAGAILRTDQSYAEHLVNDCAAAKYSKPKEKAVQTSAQDPYAHLGTLIATVSDGAAVVVQTSAQDGEQETAPAETQQPSSD